MNSQDRTTVVLMAAIPTVLVLGLVWLPAISSVILSFTDWNGIGPLSDINFIGFKNYVDIFTIYPPFWPALQHNLMWLISLFLIFTPLGMLLAVLVDREIRASRFYQTSFYLPVVLAGALIGFIGLGLGIVGGVTLALNVDVVVPFIERMLGTQLMSKEVYYISNLPSELQWRDVATITGVSFVLSLVATIYPSWRASRVNPAEALRYE